MSNVAATNKITNKTGCACVSLLWSYVPR